MPNNLPKKPASAPSRSTGPRTAAGKERSSQNARKHGLTAAKPAASPEDVAAFDRLRIELSSELQPEGPLEMLLFEQIVRSAWVLKRARHYECQLAIGDLSDSSHFDQLDRVARYASRAERSLLRLLQELRILRDRRAGRFHAPRANSAKRSPHVPHTPGSSPFIHLSEYEQARQEEQAPRPNEV